MTNGDFDAVNTPVVIPSVDNVTNDVLSPTISNEVI